MYKITCFMELLIEMIQKAFITEIRMELECSLYWVWLLGYLHFCVAEPAKPPLLNVHIMASITASMQHLAMCNDCSVR